MVKTLDAVLAQKMFLAGAKNLEAKKEWINELYFQCRTVILVQI